MSEIDYTDLHRSYICLCLCRCLYPCLCLCLCLNLTPNLHGCCLCLCLCLYLTQICTRAEEKMYLAQQNYYNSKVVVIIGIYTNITPKNRPNNNQSKMHKKGFLSCDSACTRHLSEATKYERVVAEIKVIFFFSFPLFFSLFMSCVFFLSFYSYVMLCHVMLSYVMLSNLI
jgi:hypothetical protein